MSDPDPNSLVPQICAEADFLPVLWDRLAPLARRSGFFRNAVASWGVRSYSLLAEEAFDLLSFLDHYGARANEEFSPLAEFVASIRGFAIMGATLGVLKNRLGHNYPDEQLSDGRRLSIATDDCQRFVDRALAALIEGAESEIQRLYDGKRPGVGDSKDEVDQGLPPQRLPMTIGHGEITDQDRRVVEIASKFLAHKQILDRESAGAPFDDPSAMTAYILSVSDESQCRYFETRIHTVVSRYDLFVSGTTLEPKDPDLANFRSLLAVTKHLCRVMTELVHFYESHEDDVRSERVRQRISGLVSKDEVARYAVAFCLRFMRAYTEAAAPLAAALVKRYTRHDRAVCQIPEGASLHVRPVSLIAKIVQHHGTPVTMILGGESCYAGSVVQMLMAAGTQLSEKEVIFEGDRSALDDLEVFFAAGLGELTGQPLPPQLSYLGLS